SEIRFKNNGDKVASFMITGADLDQLDRDYISGKALVNPVQFRESLNWLRDVLFKKLRETERRYEIDRKRKNRGHKKWH
ncbi:MAG: hypothetical protein HQK83_19235, partial [Fibrobacteria bacterium]|nr:hypothetical protein [Fibrobacteria bacterium]